MPSYAPPEVIMAAIGSSTLGVYNPIFYANEALIHLEKALGMAARVHRGYDAERSSFGRGDTINIRKPQTFTAADAPATAAGLATETVAITLNNWREVKFALQDNELAFTGNRIIEDHIRPAAYALAEDIDTKLVNLYKDIGVNTSWASSNAVTDITTARKQMFDLSCPLDAGRIHMMVDSTGELDCLKQEAFSQWQGAGDAGVNTQMRGTLGTKFGFEVFANQNVQTSVASGSDGSGLIDGALAAGVSTIHVDNMASSEVFLAGSIVTITSSTITDYYVVTADATMSSNEGDVAIAPALKRAAADNDVCTISIDAKSEQLAFHQNAFALVMAPLPEMGNELGARVATVSDPVTGLSLRSRVYYKGDSSQVHVAIDCLYGVKTLDSYLACRMRR